jgi:hypothetical protein
MVHLARGSRGQANKWYPFWVPFVAEARITYTSGGFSDNAGYQLNFGSLGYNYSPDAKNLGLYLLKGYVYPGTLVSGFGNVSGFLGKAKFGWLTNDFIVNMETEDKPLYDISVADVVTLSPHRSFDLGFGVNFSRLIPMDDKLTYPGKDCDPNFLGPYAKRGQDNACYIIEKDSAGNVTDTIVGGLGGIKLMARMRVDPKAWFSDGSGIFGKNDLVFYGEAGVIGLKDYNGLYNKLLRRVPAMVGFNLPGFNFLDASIEVEYYPNKLSSDNIAARSGSWVSVVDDARIDTKRDDWKWSFNASKAFFGNMALSMQVANDHLRLGGNHDEDTGVEAMRIPEDWYWTSKLAYFF